MNDEKDGDIECDAHGTPSLLSVNNRVFFGDPVGILEHQCGIVEVYSMFLQVLAELSLVPVKVHRHALLAEDPGVFAAAALGAVDDQGAALKGYAG